MNRSLQRTGILLATAILFAATGTAQSIVTPNPGLIQPGGSLYGWDMALDNIAVGLGLKDPGQVAFERASEASIALETGNTTLAKTALDDLNETVALATSNSTQGLEKARSILQSVQEKVPEEADVGLNQALTAIEQAKQRVPAQPPKQPGPDHDIPEGIGA